MPSQINFKFETSPTSNDHQVRIIVDGQDWLGDDTLGIDPPDFFKQESLTTGGQALVGRCDCGCIGCGDVMVNVLIQTDIVLWITQNANKLQFEKSSYLEHIDKNKSDFSWEDINRTAERVLGHFFSGSTIDQIYKFNWVSARCTKKIITLSYSLNDIQKLIEYPWDGENVNDSIKGAERICQEKNIFLQQNFKKN